MSSLLALLGLSLNTGVCSKKSASLAVLWLSAAVIVAPAAETRAEDCTLKRMVELPMVDNATGSPVVSINIDGQPRDILLDTGGFWSLITPEVASGFPSYASPVQGQLGVGAIRLTKIVKVPSIDIGPTRFKNVEFFLEPPGYRLFDATLGADWLSQTDVEIDPVQQKVSLFAKDHCDGKVVHWPHQDFAIVDMRIDRVEHRLTIPMTLDGHQIEALIDTGAPESFLSLHAAKRLFDLAPDSPGMIPGYPTVGEGEKKITTWRHQFSSLEMNGIAFHNPWITIAEMKGEGPDLILGMHQLRALHLYFAYGEHKLYVTTAQGDIAAQAGTADKSADRRSHPSPLDEVNAQDYFHMAEAAMQKRDYETAAAQLDKAIAIDPEYSSALAMRGQLYLMKGDRDHAMQMLKQVLAIEPKSGQGYLARSQTFERIGDYQHAFGDVDHAVALLPRSPEVLNARCWIGAILGRLDAALADCNAAVALEPKAPAILDSRAFVHLKAGRLDDAIKDYDAALAINPKMAPSLYGRGVAKRQKGDVSGGNADITAAEQAEPGVADRFGK